MVVGLALIFIFRWQINLLTLDEEEAKIWASISGATE
jgi:iron complex transport system permease protein